MTILAPGWSCGTWASPSELWVQKHISIDLWLHAGAVLCMIVLTWPVILIIERIIIFGKRGW
jgi:hypothetical protein